MVDEADRLAVIFARRLRRAGLAIPTGSVSLFVAALSTLDPADRDSVYWAGRAVLVKRPEDIDTFDAALPSSRSTAPSSISSPTSVEVPCALM